LFKSPVLNIELTFDNGNKQSYRIIPAIASSGFILSPSITNISDFFGFAIGKAKNNNIKSIKLINDSDCCYSDDIEIELSEISTQGFN